jgi:MFS family permease
MSFEELESLWGAQPPAASRPADLAALKRRLAPELRRRGRFFGYELFCLGLGLVLTPLLAVVNYLHVPPAQPVLYWLRVALFVAVVLAFLVAAVRRLRRHRALAAAGTETLTAFAAQSLAAVESEMHDYRLALRGLPVWLGLALLSIYVNQPPAAVGWTPLLLRAASVLAVVLVVGAVCWRHYHQNLTPEHARRQQVLAELG